jgi:hypothetical protein
MLGLNPGLLQRLHWKDVADFRSVYLSAAQDIEIRYPDIRIRI